ncbi:hypothetical protein SAMN04488527_101280 [Aliiroseovarius crassostreae]|uniref:Uncharacterized protein n=1 Tax=Aliiroseovarius crassostreae TaxID=154981 RepID=A0A0P7IZK6_9RHOB|nr:hypothetical protein [Aliiroseovarius crassostreae]KPN64277.1 hypothetical protein AKJ29_16725 [Aliiroseovarius crassostreae]SFU31518.1 hypothetical protein SAMN04488527_101280 [Aliiroseovarius crassostreae]
MMNLASVAQKLFDENLRLDEIVWLAGAVEGFSNDDFFEEVILDAIEGASHLHKTMAVFNSAPKWACDEEGFLEWIAQKGLYGFVVKVQTPKPVHFHPNGYTSYGFGMSSGTYIYVEDISDVVPLAIDWRNNRMAVWREQGMAS